jgi:hypothetical protein
MLCSCMENSNSATILSDNNEGEHIDCIIRNKNPLNVNNEGELKTVVSMPAAVCLNMYYVLCCLSYKKAQVMPQNKNSIYV